MFVCLNGSGSAGVAEGAAAASATPISATCIKPQYFFIAFAPLLRNLQTQLMGLRWICLLDVRLTAMPNEIRRVSLSSGGSYAVRKHCFGSGTAADLLEMPN